jgi:threonine dehydrogenase-like Zn-dependent dehydrogenase
MKAVHYEGAFKVSVKNVPLPKLEHPDDAIIKVTTAGKSFLSLTNYSIYMIIIC